MVARSNQIQWRTNPHPILNDSDRSPALGRENYNRYSTNDHRHNHSRDIDDDSSFPSNNKTKTPNRSSMETNKSDKENHLIEAIVFTADFLTCAQRSSRNMGSQWFCGNSFDEATSDNSNFDNTIGNNEGWFGMKRQKLISYENAEDLTRKVDALFHRKCTSSSSSVGSANLTQPSVPPEIRDDHPMKNDVYREISRRNPVTRTHHSKSPSMSKEELSRWYSSPWYSYTYYGKNGEEESEAYDMPRNSKNTAKQHRSQYSLPSEGFQRQGNRTRNDSEASNDSLPEFLRGMEFKRDRRSKHELPVIGLPQDPFFLPNEERSGREDSLGVAGLKRTNSPLSSHMHKSKKARGKNHVDDFRGFQTNGKIRRPRQLGRMAKNFWNKTRQMFRR